MKIVRWKCYDLSKFDFENKMDGKRCQWSTLGSSLGSMPLCFATGPNLCTSGAILSDKSSPMPIEISTWFTPFFRESKNMAPRIETNKSAFSWNQQEGSLRVPLWYVNTIPWGGCFGRILGGCQRFQGCLRFLLCAQRWADSPRLQHSCWQGSQTCCKKGGI